MSESIQEGATIEEMLDECIRARSESRSQVIGRLNDLLKALTQGKPIPKSINSHVLWVLHSDGRITRH